MLIFGGIAKPLRTSLGLYPKVGTSANITKTSFPAAAISLLQSLNNTPGGGPRVSIEAAQLLKARVALFEGT